MGGKGDDDGGLPSILDLCRACLGIVHVGLAAASLYEGLRKGPYVCLAHIALANAASVALLYVPAWWVGGGKGDTKEKAE